MLLQRGHGRILSGFFGVLSSDALVVSLWSPFLGDFVKEVSISVEGVLGFSRLHEDVGDFSSSCKTSSSCVEVHGSLWRSLHVEKMKMKEDCDGENNLEEEQVQKKNH
ncbi:hypothetical protein VIGAN_10062900 [Vigna angularis var. angularis]|uniref:Uncharacterized protein n=1 Tax=Vigna angularis var. angularis TaxID=157739 RepID=A0A0S3T259_PHAAN|nr:hypothetical protein VIGAN_10062900 [Vigna angularis var. angularis]